MFAGRLIKNGYTLYLEKMSEKSYKIIDIDVDPGVKTIAFQDPKWNIREVRLRNVKKQFPDVRILVFTDYPIDVDLSNFMFPNVEKVVYGDEISYEYPCLFMRKTLYNTFCKGPNATIDTSDVFVIQDYALEGCRAGLMSYNSNVHLKPHSFSGYLPEIPEDIKQWKQNDGFVYFPDPSDKRKLHIECLSNNDLELVDALSSFTEVTELSVGENMYYKVIDGILYTKDGEKLVKCPEGREGTVRIPEGVKIIGRKAFSDCKISEVELPSSLREIGFWSFFGCKNLKGVRLQEGIRLIRERAFYEDPKLKQITLPKSLTSLECYSLSGMDMVTLKGEIPNNLIYAVCNWKTLSKYTLTEKPYRYIVRPIICTTADGETFTIPGHVGKTAIHKLNESLKDSENFRQILYLFADEKVGRYLCAMKSYELNKSQRAKKYLRKNAFDIAHELLHRNFINDLIEFLSLRLTSHDILEKILQEISSKEIPELSACVLTLLDSSQKSFEL